jgi:tRNA threonylcarbamoyladenosine biosynthesis protein TsaB
MLRGAKVPVADLTALGVALGPGSFTAVRIGLAFVIGMAQVRNLRIIGVPTLDILAAAQPPSDLVLLAVLRAGRSRIGMAEYRFGRQGWHAEKPPVGISWQELADQAAEGSMVCGEIDTEGYAALEKRKDLKIAPAPLNVRRAGVLAALAQDRLREHHGPPPPLQPIYLSTIPAAAE